MTLQGPENETVLHARWLVDASGRAALLKRQLNSHEPADHNVNAAWFRIQGEIDPDTWSTNATWRTRTMAGLRRLSTCHLMGYGYWVWLIPLPSGATSIGIVADPGIHPLQSINRFERARDWLCQHEPQLASRIPSSRDDVLDFRVRRAGAYGCTHSFSADRWAITGEAGWFIDPLYSPGMDFIAIANTLIVDLVERELSGNSIAAHAHFADVLYRSLAEQYLQLYRGQYKVFGHPRAMLAKVIWDTAVYFGYNLLLFQNDLFCDKQFLVGIRSPSSTLARLQFQMQQFFRRLAKTGDTCTAGNGCVDQWQVLFLRELYLSSKGPYDSDVSRNRLGQNMRQLEAFAVQCSRFAEAKGTPGKTGIAKDVGLVWAA